MSETRLLRVLYLEDDDAEAAVSLEELRRGGLDVTVRVAKNLEEFRAGLEAEEWDVILANYSLAECTAIDALEVLEQEGRSVPVILVTDSLGEEAAVEGIRKGAGRSPSFRTRLSRQQPAI